MNTIPDNIPEGTRDGESIGRKVNEILDLLRREFPDDPVTDTDRQLATAALTPATWSESKEEDSIPVGTVEPYSENYVRIRAKRGWNLVRKELVEEPITKEEDGNGQ